MICVNDKCACGFFDTTSKTNCPFSDYYMKLCKDYKCTDPDYFKIELMWSKCKSAYCSNHDITIPDGYEFAGYEFEDTPNLYPTPYCSKYSKDKTLEVWFYATHKVYRRIK